MSALASHHETHSSETEDEEEEGGGFGDGGSIYKSSETQINRTPNIIVTIEYVITAEKSLPASIRVNRIPKSYELPVNGAYCKSKKITNKKSKTNKSPDSPPW